MDRARTLEVIDEASDRLAAAATSPHVTVTSCPGWDIAELIYHVGVVGDFWSELVEGAISSPGQFSAPDRPDGDDLPGWCDARLGRLARVLAASDPTTAVWTWSADHTVGFVARRMAHELTVHAWDADAALARARPVATDVAVDGIDELLDAFLFRVSIPERFAGGEGVHLHCTDTDLADGTGEWVVRAEDGRWLVERHHAKQACAARGAASELLLAVWGRAPLDTLATFGDRTLLEELLDGIHTSMTRRS